MSGHNKWSKIKHKKATADLKRSNVFGKILRLITAQSKTANGDITSPNLRAAIEKARSFNIPKENIDRAVKKGMQNEGSASFEITYEAYGPGGVAIIIEALSDNRNKTAAEIKHLLGTYQLALATPGAATWAFKKEGMVWIPETTIPIKEKEWATLEELIKELDQHEDVQDVFTNAVTQ